jgi:23S rRNA (adenine1618-N6)-methyltransferase
MHQQNPHSKGYNFDKLITSSPTLEPFVIITAHGNKSIDFSKAPAVFELNKALLVEHYGLTDYQLPRNYLIPPVPGRADYLWHINDLLIKLKILNNETQIQGLDIGTGANGIYPILGSQQFGWNMVGSDIDITAVAIAENNRKINSLEKQIEIRHQPDPSNLFKEIIRPEEKFHFTMCNPPFHASAKDAEKEALRKINNLKLPKTDLTNELALNFQGQANELWCNGGEALFIKRLIKDSTFFKEQVGVFTSLVAKEVHLPKIRKQLDKLNAKHTTVEMGQGNKKSRIIAWWF